MGACSASQAEGVTVMSQSAFASSAAKNRSTQRVLPQQCSNVSGQPPNFSPSSPMTPSRVPSGVALEVGDHVVDLAEWNAVTETLLGTEDGQQGSLVLGDIGSPQGVLRHRCRPEVGVVENRPAVARPGNGHGQVGLPDTLREPGPGWADADQPLDLVRHPPQLADPIA